jgi:hypothetical protein
METITELHVFDFDETIVRMPSFTGKKQVETDDLKFDHPYDFYDHPESLSESAYHIQLISPVYEAWQRASRLETCYTILVTHRVKSLEKEVKAVLDARGVEFNEYFFLGRVREKIEILNEVLEKLPNVKEVSIYEDSIQQLHRYQTYLEYREDISFKLHMVDKSKVYQIDPFTVRNEKKIRLV